MNANGVTAPVLPVERLVRPSLPQIAPHILYMLFIRLRKRVRAAVPRRGDVIIEFVFLREQHGAQSVFARAGDWAGRYTRMNVCVVGAVNALVLLQEDRCLPPLAAHRLVAHRVLHCRVDLQ